MGWKRMQKEEKLFNQGRKMGLITQTRGHRACERWEEYKKGHMDHRTSMKDEKWTYKES